MFTSAIIAAGGRGQRFGGAVPKQLLTIEGRPILERSVALFLAHPQVDEVIVAVPPDVAVNPPAYLRAGSKPIRVVPGGPRRQDSVANAFAAVSDEAEIVVIHDAARPFASADLLSRTIEAAAESGAAIAALQPRDTVKRAVDGPAGGEDGPAEAGRHVHVRETLPRESIYLAQTPQAFRRNVLRDALALGQLDATDEASLAERAGHPVRLVEGEESNIKVTLPDDLRVAEMRARAGKPARTGRVGTGYDLHRLAPGRRLKIGGVSVPSDRGPVAHSDGDVVCHAIVDAILGAAGLGDIGRQFPDTDPRWKDASGVDLLARAAALAAEQGFEVGNVDATVILESPKISTHVNAMREAIAAAVGVDVSRVSVKGKTNEGLDAIGRGEAIAAHAVAIVRQSR